MDNTQVYNTILGKNYLTYLMSFGLLEKSKDVMMIDDIRKLPQLKSTDSIWELEKNILKAWGTDFNLYPLKNIDSYLSAVPLLFSIDDKIVYLGSNPWGNFRELLRKFPETFGEEAIFNFSRFKEEKFNESFFTFTARLGELIFRFKNSPNLNFDTFRENCPIEFRNLFEKFAEGAPNSKALRFLCQAFYQRKIAREVSEFELFHLFLCILSPYYEINQSKIEADLDAVFKENGGQYVNTTIDNLEFKGRKIWKINLAKDDTLVTKDVFFSKGNFSSYSFKVSPNLPLYTCVKVHWKFPVPLNENLTGKKVILTNEERMGSFSPYSEIKVDEQSLLAEVLVPFESGAKVDFYKKLVKAQLKDDLSKVLGDWWVEPTHESMEMGEALWPLISRKTFSLGRVEFKLPKKLTLKGISKSKKLFGLKNLHYVGNLDALGLLSTLMEIKDLRPYK